MFSHLPVKRLSGSLRLPVVFYRSPMFPMPFLPVGVRRFSVDLESRVDSRVDDLTKEVKPFLPVGVRRFSVVLESRFNDLTKEVKTLRDEMKTGMS
jgi:hypothetical protein